MFTIDIVLGVLKKVFGSVFSFLWEYKGWILLGVIVGALYIRGNNYRDDFKDEAVAHVKTVLTYEQTINDIRLANETALRVAQEKSEANYKALVEKTGLIQKEYSQREEDINTTITKLNSSNNSLHQSIKDFTKRNPDSSEGSLRNTSDAERIFIISGLLETCSTESIYYANEAAKLSNSVKALQEWGSLVVGGDKELN